MLFAQLLLEEILIEYSQKRKEHHRLDAQELRNRPHRSEFVLVGFVEQHQAVHGNELGAIVDEHNVRECYVRLENALTVDAIHLTDAEKKDIYSYYCSNGFSGLQGGHTRPRRS